MIRNDILSSHREQEPENGVLYLVGTPIGNLQDISSRALNILKKVSLIICEDTRQTMKIMNKFEFKNKLISFNKHNSLNKIPKIREDLKSGKSIALVSDAGMPLICDPGEELVKEIKLNNINVISIPGPCAAITALVTSGFPTSRFIFEGFLPKNKSDRNKTLMRISNHKDTTIFYESPHRLKSLLKDLKNHCGGDRRLQISKELTKRFEEHIGPDIDNAIKFFENKEVKGEFTLVLSGNNNQKKKDIDKTRLRNDLCDLVNAGLSLSSASKYIAKKENLTKSQIYNLY